MWLPFFIPSPMNREILRLAIPNILSNISVPLLSTVDTALMGRLSELHIGAVGLGAMIFNFIYWNFGFLRMGTTGVTAQAFGANQHQRVVHTLGRALLIGMVVAFVLLVLQQPLVQVSNRLMQVPENQTGLVETYFLIRIWAAPASLALYGLMGWFFGMQNAIYPLILTLFINLVNITLSYYLVQVLGWEVAGVAWGTVVAQYAGVLLAVVLIIQRYRSYWTHFERKALLKWNEFSGFLRINSDIFIRTLALTFAFAFFYSRSAAYGVMILAVNTILMQFLNWMSYGVDGFAYAAEALVGKYVGMKNEQQTRRSIRYALGWGMALAALFSLLYGVGGPWLLRVFTDQADVIAATQPYLWWMVLLPIIGTPSYIWDGIFVGLTASQSMRNSMLAAFAIFLLVYFLFAGPLGNNGLWVALLVFLLARGAFQHGLYLWKGLDLK